VGEDSVFVRRGVLRIHVFADVAALPAKGNVLYIYRVLDDGTGALADYAWNPNLAAYVKLTGGGGGGGGSRVRKTIAFVDNPYTMAAAPGTDDTLYVNTTGGDVDVFLPSAVLFGPNSERRVKNIGPNKVNIRRKVASADLIDGDVIYTMATPQESAIFESNAGVAWSTF